MLFRSNGMILACQYARENNVPFLGICLGLQMASIEFARNVLGYQDANSVEFSEDTKNPIIHETEYQKKATELGGSMRLGDYRCEIKEGSLASKLYGVDMISERHRHRYEFNSDYIDEFEKDGFVVSGKNPDNGLVEIIEYPKNDFYIACQFHPEFKSRPTNPHPLFTGLIQKSLEK